MTKLDIIMPIHRVHEYLNQSIESVINQSFTDFRLLVVDDSDDEVVTAHIKETFRDSRIEILRSNHRSVEGALNIGLEHCNAKYIARMDADDIAFKNRFERQIAYLEQHPHVGILGARATLIDSNNRVIGKFYPPGKPEQIKESLIHLVNPMIHPLVIFNVDQIGFFRYSTNRSFMEDLGLWVTMIDDVVFSNMMETLLYYRVHEKQTSRRSYSIEQLMEMTSEIRNSRFYLNMPIDKQKRVQLFLENLIRLRTSKLSSLKFDSVLRAYSASNYFGTKLILEYFGTIGARASVRIIACEKIQLSKKVKLLVILTKRYWKAKLKRAVYPLGKEI